MRIKITKPGIYGAAGMVAVGTELTVEEEPKGWNGRYEVISGGTKGKTSVTNPKPDHDTPARSPAEVLAMFSDPNVEFFTAKAEAKKVLGDATPSKKDDIVKALEELATQPE